MTGEVYYRGGSLQGRYTTDNAHCKEAHRATQLGTGLEKISQSANQSDSRSVNWSAWQSLCYPVHQPVSKWFSLIQLIYQPVNQSNNKQATASSQSASSLTRQAVPDWILLLSLWATGKNSDSQHARWKSLISSLGVHCRASLSLSTERVRERKRGRKK